MTTLRAVTDTRADMETWQQILTGWTVTNYRDGTISWRAPGQTTGITASTIGHRFTAITSYRAFEAGNVYPVDVVRDLLSLTDDELAAANMAGGADPDEAYHDQRVADEARQMRVRRDARRLLEAEAGADVEIPAPARLDEFLAVADPDPEYRIDGLLPTGGNVVLAAQHKAGKSTLVANLIRAVVDGEEFLDRHPTRPATVVLVDDELDPRTLRRWLAEQGIRNEAAVSVVSLRGRVGAFDILNEQVRARWAEQLRGADLLVFDCLRPALDALGLDENHDAGRFLVALDALKAAAGIDELVLVHHMGHSGDRSRGDSRILDWPDALWRIVREKPDDPDSPRYFSAFGRDVDVKETRLDYDPADRRLRASGESRRMAAIDIACEAVVDVLREGDPGGMTQREIERALKESGIPRSDVREGIYQLNKRGRTVIVPGARNAKMHLLLPDLASAP